MSKAWKGNGNSIWKTLGASNHTDKDREPSDFYSTDPKALDLFYPKFPIHHKVWECACGEDAREHVDYETMNSLDVKDKVCPVVVFPISSF